MKVDLSWAKPLVSRENPPWIAYIVCTLWFLLDPALNLWRVWEGWVTFSMVSWAWGLAMGAITLLWMVFHRYGGSALALTIVSVFLFLWGLADVIRVDALPNPYQLYGLWDKYGISIESALIIYSMFLSWLASWDACVIVILLAARKYNRWANKQA